MYGREKHRLPLRHRLHADYRGWLSQHEAERAQVWRDTYRSALEAPGLLAALIGDLRASWAGPEANRSRITEHDSTVAPTSRGNRVPRPLRRDRRRPPLNVAVVLRIGQGCCAAVAPA